MTDPNRSQPSLSNYNDIGYLKGIFLDAYLLSKHLPGSTPPMMFPDLAFILRTYNIILSDENLYAPKAIKELRKPIRF